jgi:hypothetical protein
MYEITSKPLVSRTFATFRSAEFGFFGVVVYTRVQTPRLAGQFASAGTLLLVSGALRDFRTNWLIVGIFSNFQKAEAAFKLRRPGIHVSRAARGLAAPFAKRPDYKGKFRPASTGRDVLLGRSFLDYQLVPERNVFANGLHSSSAVIGQTRTCRNESTYNDVFL